MIKPTVGRVVWYNPLPHFRMYVHDQPLAATITHVWSDNCVNLRVDREDGSTTGMTSVLLAQDRDASPGECQWMPHQVGQAKKHESEAAAGERPKATASEANIETKIVEAGATAPRLTPADLDANIVDTEIVEQTTKSGQVLRWAILTTKNGFAVTGKPSVAVSPENDRPAIGRDIAVENARHELWALMGYALKEQLHQAANNVAQMPKSGSFMIERIARVCHEVNRAYCAALGDHSQPAWEGAPSWQRESARMGVDLHLMGDFGPEASHISWMNQKLSDGWTFGSAKDPEKKTHPCIVPFDQLPPEQQAKDFIFRAVVHALR